MYYWNMKDGNFEPLYTIVRGFDGPVYCSQIVGGFVYVGGDFSMYNGTTRVRIAKVNFMTGELDSTFNSSTGFSGAAYCLLYYDSTSLYVGGAFTTYKGTTRQRVAKISPATAALDATFNSASGFDAEVYSLLNFGSTTLLCGGAFTTYKGSARGRYAAIGLSDAAINVNVRSSFNNTVYKIGPATSTHIAMGGAFTTATSPYNGTFTRNKIAKVDIATDQIVSGFNSASGFDSTVTTFSLSGTSQYVGGAFTTYKGTTRQGICKISDTDASLDATFDSASGASGTVWDLKLDGTSLLVGGDFTTYKGTTQSCMVKVSATDASLDATFNKGFTGTSGAVRAINVSGGYLSVGGLFTSQTTTGSLCYRQARLNKTNANLEITMTGS